MVLSKFLAEHEDIAHCCPKSCHECFRDWELKGLPSLHVTLWLLRDMLCRWVLFLSLSGSGRGDLSIYDKRYQQSYKEWASWCAHKGLPNNAFSVLYLTYFPIHLYGILLAW